jgi:hypothetical protein
MKTGHREEPSPAVAEPLATEEPTPAPRTRRAFMKMVAAGSTALLIAGPARRSRAATAARKAAAPAPDTTAVSRAGIHPALKSEIEKQKQYTLDSVKKIRDYQLPAGSPQGFSFAPMPARRKSRRAR